MYQTKRMTALLILFALLFILAGCGNTAGNSAEPVNEQTQESDTAVTESESEEPAQTESEPEPVAEETAPEEEPPAEEETGSSILVLYFSRTGEQHNVGVIDKGNTEIVAEMIAEQTGADLFEVLPKDDYYPMTYKELTDVAKQELNDGVRPEYAGALELSRYETVFIGAPVWWGDWPMIMYTVFENNDFSGKKLVPFYTHEGSGLSGFDRKLAAACPDSEVLEGLAIRGKDAQNDRDSVNSTVADWLSGLGY